ncbi:MAG: toll/interleukin-1 receptor domain-containing protein [Polyangiaceae bacterium]|nr:toll/interleukin-1 receptor domain-containing protein [Polyangiaceae bacterium]
MARSPNPLGKAVHSKVHTDAYYFAVERLLQKAKTKGDAIQTLRFIAGQLEKGIMPPDLWSVRELAVDLCGRSEAEKLAEALRKVKRGERDLESKPACDVYLSFSRFEASVARALRDRLEKDGLRVQEASDAQATAFRDFLLRTVGNAFFVCLLSPSYIHSKLWADGLHWIRLYGRAVFPNRFIPIMVRDTVIPWQLRHTYLDFRTEKQIEANYPRLLQMLKSKPA